MDSCPPKGVISLASPRRDIWLSNDIHLWLQILAHAGPQAPSAHTHKHLVYISESPCQHTGSSMPQTPRPAPAHRLPIPGTCSPITQRDSPTPSSLPALSLLDSTGLVQFVSFSLVSGLFQRLLDILFLLSIIKTFHLVEWAILVVSLLCVLTYKYITCSGLKQHDLSYNFGSQKPVIISICSSQDLGGLTSSQSSEGRSCVFAFFICQELLVFLGCGSFPHLQYVSLLPLLHSLELFYF